MPAQSIDVQSAKNMIKNGQVLVVDIRDPRTYSEGHLPGALSVGPQSVKEFMTQADRNKPLICYCYHGISSQSAAEYFFQNGFKTVYSLTGGYEAWVAEHQVILEDLGDGGQ
ncbi:MAG: thiosulfate sulfurtransferase GlpE [Candidatus Omnitrophota bacterium]|nr:thiosulfate sulfurtransferase GlpE [Candidatus Omnitrophota bacterium]